MQDVEQTTEKSTSKVLCYQQAYSFLSNWFFLQKFVKLSLNGHSQTFIHTQTRAFIISTILFAFLCPNRSFEHLIFFNHYHVPVYLLLILPLSSISIYTTNHCNKTIPTKVISTKKNKIFGK